MTADALIQLAQEHLSIQLTPQIAAQLERFAALLLETNQRLNLTRITDPDEVRVKHLLDALTPLTLDNLPENATCIDVGAGGGIPGIPLAIARPGWSMSLLEATGKKVDFMQSVLTALSLKGQAVKGRAEEAGQTPQHREGYDLVLARALAWMPTLAEYLLPLCKVGGRCIVMKGETVHRELEEAHYAIQRLGGAVGAVKSVHLPTIETPHYLVTLNKVAPTPDQFPRRTGVPSKRPLLAD